jgi:hypothetical protein
LLGHLARAEAEHVAQQQHGALACGQALQRHDEGEFDALPGHRVCLRSEPVVGVRLQPGRVGAGRQLAARPAGEHGQAAVRRDPEQPRPQSGPVVEPVERPPGPDEGLLQRVVGVMDGAEHPVAVRVDLGAYRRDQGGEGLGVHVVHHAGHPDTPPERDEVAEPRDGAVSRRRSGARTPYPRE